MIKDITTMSLGELNVLLRRLENELEYWENEKIILMESSQNVTSSLIEKTKGGLTKDDKAIVDKIIEKVEPAIKEVKENIESVKRFIFTKEQALKKEDIGKLIAYYHEEKLVIDKNTKRRRKMKWQEIATELKYNKDHVRKMYRVYKKNQKRL